MTIPSDSGTNTGAPTTTQSNTTVINGVTYTRDASGYWRDPFGQIGNIVPGKNPITGFPDPKNPVFEPLDKWLQPDPNGSGSSPSRLASDDPRYWQYQYDQLYQDAINNGLDAETARRQALAGLIANRNSTAADLYSTDVTSAKNAAEFAANPRDALSDLYYRNAVGGQTPYGDQNNPAGTQLQQNLFNRFQEIFGNVAGSRAKAWEFASAIPPAEYLQPSVTGMGAGGVNQNTTLPAAQPAPAPGGMPQLTQGAAENYANFDRMNAAVNSGQGEAFKKWVTAASGAPGAAMGGTFNFDPGVGQEDRGHTPTSTEGGLNINLFEPAVIMGIDSGKIYAKLAEPRPDGTRRGEQVVVKPLKSETAKDKAYEQMGKAPVANGMPAPGLAGGGQVNVIPKPWDFLDELKKNLQGIGGTGGNAGGATDPNTGVAPLRLYAGAPDAMMSPTQRQYLYAAQSQAGVSPEEVDWTLKQFSPSSAQRWGQNSPRVSF